MGVLPDITRVKIRRIAVLIQNLRGAGYRTFRIILNYDIIQYYISSVLNNIPPIDSLINGNGGARSGIGIFPAAPVDRGILVNGDIRLPNEYRG